jgi:uncharacterized protein YyaL (SSP411 family)
MPNRLASESSPYLLQHKDNPVDWYPWGDDAFERARAEDKPLLLSIGYAACHWCHVMEHESFEDPETAAIMNEHFIPVKVDREERPDLDSVYMDAVQAMTGSGGWPMTVFLTPDGAPFYGGTYFPPIDQHGLPSFKRLLLAISETWRERRSEVDSQGRRLIDHIQLGSQLRPSREPITSSILNEALTSLRQNFDSSYGGFGSAPKFPQPMTIDLLLRLANKGHEQADRMAMTTLGAMAAGGIYDQLRGGFHRYSVDRYWIVPHFEKMLYDNAQLLRTYVRSWQRSRSDRHREVAEATATWMLEEMQSPQGGFYSTIDADSEGGEGAYYVWSLAEVAEVTGEDGGAAVDYFGFMEAGNFEGHNIPVHTGKPSSDAVERARRALLERRAQRPRPETDTKILTAWNGLAASALAEAGAVLRREDWIDAAERALSFVLDRARVDGRLMRSYRQTDNGPVVKHLGYCDDYAFVLEGSLALFEATARGRWLEEAIWSADEAIRLFADEAGGFFSTGVDAERLVARPKELQDNAIPSANSVLALELQKLAHITGRRDLDTRAVDAMRLIRDVAARAPQGFGHWLGAIDFYTASPVEVAIVGRSPQERSPFLEVVHERFRPNKVLVASSPDSALVPIVPLLQGRGLINDGTAAYVCRNGVCDLPVTTPEDLRRQL